MLFIYCGPNFCFTFKRITRPYLISLCFASDALQNVITGTGSYLFIKSQNCTLVDRSELFKLVVWFMMEEKLQSRYCSLQGRECYGGCSKLTISMFVSVRIDGLGKVWKNWCCKHWQLLGILNLAGKIYNVRHAWTLKEISKTHEWVHTSDNIGTTLHKWKPMGLTGSKFWLLDPLGSSEI